MILFAFKEFKVGMHNSNTNKCTLMIAYKFRTTISEVDNCYDQHIIVFYVLPISKLKFI